MNERRSRSILHPLALAALLVLGGCSAERHQAPPLEGARIGGPFSLTDQNGRTVRDTDFAGRYRLIYFGYSFCPDICPTDLQTIGRAVAKFEQQSPERAARLQPIFITVDPERDTPAVLKPYVAAFHPRLIGLTGTPQQLEQVRRAFGVVATKPPGAPPKDYLVDHSRMTILFGREGQPIVLVNDDEGVDGVVKALDQWVK